MDNLVEDPTNPASAADPPTARCDLHAERALIMMQLMSPPLPLLCIGSSGDGRRGDRVSSSHDLIFSILGRLLSIPEEDSKCMAHVLSDAGFKGDWKAHVLKGEHAITLLRGMAGAIAGDEGAKKKKPTEEDLYEMLCTYTREVLTILMTYDMATMYSASQWKAKAASFPALDIRFLRDTGRVSFSLRPALVLSAIDFTCSFAVLRGKEGMNVDALRADLMRLKDYKLTLARYARILQQVARGILEVEMGGGEVSKK